MKRNIILCGFMGCGKSSVGKRTAKMIDRGFCDMDRFIEQKSGMRVKEIFEKLGEPAFRKMERDAAIEMGKRGGLIIASGGGTVLDPRNVDAFHEAGGVILLLDVPLAALQERLKGDKRRPLLQTPNRRETINQLFHQRMPLYQAAADDVIPAGAPTVVVAERIRDYMQENSLL